MQPGRARTSGLGVPLLPLARWVGWVAPVRPTLGLWFVAPCSSAALGACAPASSGASWRVFIGAHALCVLCVVSVATWRVLPMCALCVACVYCWWLRRGHPPPAFCVLTCVSFSSFCLVPSFFCVYSSFFCDAFCICLSPLFCFFLREKYNGKAARVHCRHRHGQLAQRCSSAVFLLVVCVAAALLAVAPQGCGTRVLMYMGAG